MRRRMMRMAVIYARVSSEQQREEKTIASQTASLIEFARSHELEVPKEWVFEDEGYSGATLERPGLERVRDLAAEGQIQVVLAYSPDRLSRKYAYQILLIEEFARHGVETLFVKSPQGNSPEDHLLVQFQGMIAEYERAQILERSRRGKRQRAQAGEVSVMSGAPYGYRYIRKTDEALAAYLVEETEASLVRRVYHMYTVDGLSIAEITRRLNREGIPPRRAGRWERSVIWSILRNPVLCKNSISLKCLESEAAVGDSALDLISSGKKSTMGFYERCGLSPKGARRPDQKPSSAGGIRTIPEIT